MKSPKRPPLKLTDDEGVAPVELSITDETPSDDATSELEPIPEPDFEIIQPTFEEPPFDPPPFDPPMSERRRRRRMRQQRQEEVSGASRIQNRVHCLGR